MAKIAITSGRPNSTALAAVGRSLLLLHLGETGRREEGMDSLWAYLTRSMRPE